MASVDASALDPGWGEAVRIWARNLIPRGRFEASSVLVQLRAVWLAFVMAMVIITLLFAVLVATDSFEGQLASGLASAVIGSVGVIALLASAWIGRRPLDCAEAATMQRQYAGRFFARLALGEGPLLAAVPLTVLSGRPGPLVAGTTLSTIGLLLAAPTRSRIARDDAELAGSGCPEQLVCALMLPPQLDDS